PHPEADIKIMTNAKRIEQIFFIAIPLSKATDRHACLPVAFFNLLFYNYFFSLQSLQHNRHLA
ncbi:MAG: hypothetical protein RR724_02395, partial [Hydrogenoanaerobacterium sp.]